MRYLFFLIILSTCHMVLAQGHEFETKAENLGAVVNGPYGEIGPMISPDGRLLFFTGDDMPSNTGSPEKQDIYVCELQEDGEWGAPRNIGSPINNNYHNFINNITPDNNIMVLGNKYNYFDGSVSSGLSFAIRDARGWQFPKAQTIDKFENKSDYAGYFLSADRRVLLLAIEAKKTLGERDLYVSFKEGENEWSKPTQMGAVINTSGDEDSPFLAADGKTLYFSSDGIEGGYGDKDIWVSKRLDNTWLNWSPPKNMGPILNNEGWNSNFSIPASGEYAYYNSNVDGQGGIDIWRIRLEPEQKPDPVVLIRGHVLDSKTKEPLEAEIIYEDLNTGEIAGFARSGGKDGSYNIVLPAGKRYGFRADGKGYYAVNSNIDVMKLESYGEVEQDILMTPIKSGEEIKLNNIFFETAKAVLLPESFPELKRVALLMEENPGLEIKLNGHTDNQGSDASNLTLSQARAKSVMEYLISQGVKKGRMSSEGYGETKPVDTNETEEGRANNRRVSFAIVKG